MLKFILNFAENILNGQKINMNREIKFRIYDDSPVKDGFGGLMINHEYIMQSDYLKDALNGQYPIMQYTGLKDKNGVEIYEGDILHKKEDDWSEFDGWSHDDPRWDPYNKNEKEIPLKITKVDYCTLERFRFWLKNESFGYEGEDMERPEDWEIIGNIHQNPELLNQ